MMPVLLSNRSRRPAGTVTPTWFLGTMASISPGNLRALWLPTSADTTTNVSRSDLRVWTYDATIAARISTQGNGVLVSFSGTGQFLTAVDAADLSFTSGAMSIAYLANVTDTAGHRVVFSKTGLGGINNEYSLAVTGADKLQFDMTDQSAGVNARRVSDAVITQGALHTFGVSVADVAGGATAASGVVLLQDGAVIASTATENASYVTMEDLTAKVSISGERQGTLNLFVGSLGFLALYAANLSTAQHGQIKAAVNKFYGLSL